MTRKIIQIAFETQGSAADIYNITYALCDDGTVWYMRHTHTEWKLLLPPIPQDPIEEVKEDV